MAAFAGKAGDSWAFQVVEGVAGLIWVEGAFWNGFIHGKQFI